MRLLVIDGNSIANRAFFGIKLLTTKDGRYTNAIFGFLNILNSLLKECSPDEVAVAFDLKAPTFRHKMYDGYKATRHGMPDELAQQMPVLKELLTDLGYRQVTAEGWEADDILGTLAAACDARKDDCFLATGDRDSLQLVSETTTVLLATTALGRSKTVAMDVAAIEEKYGIQPRQLIEVKSLMGDASDNIPGVRGIGEKTALALVQRFGTLENVYANLDDKVIKPKQREHLLECRADAELSHLLGTIRTDAPIDTAEGAYKVGEGNKGAAVRLMQELELHTLIPRFGLDGVAPEAAPEEVPTLEGTVSQPARNPRRALSGGHPPRRHGPRGREKCRFAAGSVVRRAGQHRLPPEQRRAGAAAGRPRRDAGRLRLRSPLRAGHGPRRLGQQHRLGRQAGCLPAGRLGLEVSGHRAADQLPCQGRLHL